MPLNAFPSDWHSGLIYYDFMAQLSQKRETRSYLEVGVNQGRMMSRIQATHAVGVDPAYILDSDVTIGKKSVTLVNATSDTFFATPNLVDFLRSPPDLVFLDGYHTFEFLLRDFINSEKISARNALIVLHDCLPLDSTMAIRHIDTWKSQTVGTKYAGAWTGDVWKLLPILRKYRPELKILLADCSPTGLVLISNCDPRSTLLDDKYLDIVSEFLEMPNDDEGIVDNLYKNFSIVEAKSILTESDHSLHFRL